MKKVLLVTLLASMIALPVYATPTGLISIPSTDFAPENKLHMDIDNYNGQGISYPVYGLTYGFKNGEVGIDYYPDYAQDQALFNLKFGVVDKGNFKVVVGAMGLGGDTTKQDLVYVMASQRAKDGTRFSLGYGVGDEDNLTPDENIFMAGIDKQLNDKWWAAVDYLSGDSSLGTLNFGVSYAFAPNASILFGYNVYNNDSENTFTTQIDINF